VPDLRFRVEGAQAVAHAASPLVSLRLHISNAAADPIHAVLLRCQVQIEAPRRAYEESEQEGLADLFGAPARWATTLKPLLWTQLGVTVPGFAGETRFELQVPCTVDLNVASGKYFQSLASGAVPLLLLFSGTAFHAAPDGALQAAPIPWSSEARFTLQLAVVREAIEACFPNAGFLTLQRDVLDRLYRYKVRSGLPTWERAIEALLERTP